MPHGLGKLHVHKDPSLMMTKVGYDVMLNYGVSEQMLMSAKFPQDVLAHIAKDMAKAIERDIFELLLTSSLAPDSLHGITNYGDAQKQKYQTLHDEATASWNDPNTDVLASIQQASEVIKNSQSGPSLFHQPTQAEGVLETLTKAIPGLKGAKASCPANKVCGEGPYKDQPVSTLIMHLNDQHNWTRERIADWLETLDFDLSFQEPTAAPPEPPSAYEKFCGKDDDKLDALKFALMTQPVLDPKNTAALIKGITIT